MQAGNHLDPHLHGYKHVDSIGGRLWAGEAIVEEVLVARMLAKLQGHSGPCPVDDQCGVLEGGKASPKPLPRLGVETTFLTVALPAVGQETLHHVLIRLEICDVGNRWAKASSLCLSLRFRFWLLRLSWNGIFFHRWLCAACRSPL